MYFAIEGVIGVGKTTLARMLQPAFQSNLLLEVFEENPFLSQFYGDRARYAFQTQIFFLLSRYHQQNQSIPTMLEEKELLISDYTFEKDALFARINLSGAPLTERRFLLMYQRVHEALAEKMVHPDLVVYLRASTQRLLQRINQRDRTYERNMDADYIQQVNQAYDDFFMNNAGLSIPVLVLDGNQLDFVARPSDLYWVENRIRQAYYGRAVEALVNDFPEAALWTLLRTWTLAACSLPSDVEIKTSWNRICQAVYLDVEHVEERVNGLDSYLDTVEEILDAHAKSQGL